MSFSSLYQFPLLSTQQQGVELYTLFRRHMDIEELYRDISTEIDTWDRVIAQHNEESLNSRLSFITYLGLPVAIVTMLLTGYTFLRDLPVRNGTALKDFLWGFRLWGHPLSLWGHLVFDLFTWVAIMTVSAVIIRLWSRSIQHR